MPPTTANRAGSPARAPHRHAGARSAAAADLFLRLSLLVLSAACAAPLDSSPPAVLSRLDACRAIDLPQIQWIVPRNPATRVALDAWCGGVGTPIVNRSPAANDTIADEVTVVSWNTHAGAGDVSGFAARLRAGDFTGGTPIRHFVLLLQEAYRAGPEVPHRGATAFPLPRPLRPPPPEHGIAAISASLGAALVYVPSMRNSDLREDRGNAILSTLPVGKLTFVELPFEKQRRVAIVAAVTGVTTAGEPWRLTVANVHFDTAVALSRGGPAAARSRQASLIIDVLAAVAPPLVVAGDLNTWWGDDEPAVRAMREAFPDAGPLAARDTWRGPLGAGSKMDHMFARTRTAVAVRRVPDRFGSDHHPLIATVDVAHFAGPAAPRRVAMYPLRARTR